MTRFFEWFPLGVLALWGCVGLGRALVMHRRGVKVVALDRSRTILQFIADGIAFICLLVFAYEVVAYAWPLAFHAGPVVLESVLLDARIAKVAGALISIMALLIYGLAVIRLGASWKLGIDRDRPGELITRGIYAWSRHPIYLAFDLFFVGTFLTLGRLVFLVIALIMIPILHAQMLREERFLAQTFGERYPEYRKRAGRYLSFPA